MEMSEKSALIQRISAASDRYGDKLVDFMNRYGLYCLAEATVEQLREYVALHSEEWRKPT